MVAPRVGMLDRRGRIPLVLLFALLSSCASQRVALVIGNAAYTQSLHALRNPANDAKSMGAALQRLDFDVTYGTNLDRSSMVSLLKRFSSVAARSRVVLFYYSGHGFQLNGENYLVPVDVANLSDDSISLSDVGRLLEKSFQEKILIIDACRRNPLKDSLGKGTQTLFVDELAEGAPLRDGLAEVQAGADTIIAFAAAPNHVSYDGAGDNSPFTTALVNHIEAPNVEINSMLRAVREDVVSSTDGKQVPAVQSLLRKPFYFRSESFLLTW